jgi:hypothetical protein
MGFVVRTDTGEESVADAAALRARARAGALPRDTPVRVGEGPWTPAERVPELVGAWLDVWSAWEDADSVDAKAVYREMTEDAVPELPAHALDEVAGRPDAADDPVEVPLDALTPLSVAPMPVELPRAQRAEENSVPARVARASDALPALPPEFAMLEAQRRTRTTEPAGARGKVYVYAVLALGLLGVGAYLWTSSSRASARFEQRHARISEATREDPVAAPAPVDTAKLAARRVTEATLRARLPPNLREVRREGDLTDAIMLDLAQMQVRARSVDTRVVRWTGRKLDEPRAAEVRVGWDPGEDPDRELGAIALVVGRYARSYRMDLPVFTVEDDAGVLLAPRNTDVQEFYLGRLDLHRFLGTLGR